MNPLQRGSAPAARAETDEQTNHNAGRAAKAEAVVTGSLVADFPDKLPPSLARLVHDAPDSCADLRHGKILAAVRQCAADGESVNVVTVTRRLKNVSREYLAGLILDTLPISVADSEAEQLCALYQVRRTKSIFIEALASLEAVPNKSGAIADNARTALEQLRKETATNDGLPEIVDAAKFLTEPIEPPAELVSGILHKGSKLAFGGSSKSFKTWCLLDLAISVATGEKWLGRDTASGKVLFVNFEIQSHAWQRRISAIVEAKGVQLDPGMVDLFNLRGYAADFRQLIPIIIERARREGYALAVLDPLYKLYGRTDENSAGDVAELLNSLERLAAETGAAIAFGAHFAKGNASAKEAIDRISGSGVFARDPDSLLIFTKHETEDAFTVESILRNFAPVAPFAVRWQFPLMYPADDLDPSKLKQVAGRKPTYATDDLLELLPESGFTNTEWLEKSSGEGISKATFYRLRKLLEMAKKIHFSTVTAKWQPISTK